jgi:hypothetical protein
MFTWPVRVEGAVLSSRIAGGGTVSKTFYVAAGILLLLVATVLGFLGVTDAGERAHRAFVMAGIFGGIGFVLLVAGMRNPFDPAHRRYVRRKLTPWNLLIGPTVIALAIGVLYLFFNVIQLMPRIVVIGALVAVPIGVFITASIFGDACVRCDRLLETKTLRFAALADSALDRLKAGDIESALAILGAPTPEGTAPVEVSYCPLCRSVAVCRAGGTTAVLREMKARLLTELAKRDGASELGSGHQYGLGRSYEGRDRIASAARGPTPRR